MIKFICLSLLCIFVSSSLWAQVPPKQLPAKPNEQKEIKADKHLEKAIQQKQLSAPAEMLQEQAEKTSALNKATANKINRNKRVKKNRANKK